MVANAAITPTIQLGEEFKSVADLDGKTFAIVNKAEQKALFGSSAQNLGYDVYSNAFVTTNSGYLWKLVSLADNADESIRGYYMLRLITPSGGEYNIWGSPGFLNTQPADQAVSFILGITGKKNGQDIDNGAVYDVQYEEGKGFSLKNIGTGLYQGANTAPAKNEEPTYFTFATVTTTYVPALKALLAEGEAMKKRGASSADYDAAIEGIDPDKSADALADAQKVEAALPALAKTQLTAGSDFTRAIANFDCAAKDGWTFDKPKGGNGPDHGGDFEYWAGNASNRAEASFDYWQEITGLPNGTYTVSAEMYNSLNNEGGNYTEFKPTVGVYATVGEKTVSKLVDVNSETRVPYVTDAIEVTDGKIRIGAKSFEAPMAARWFTVDNFKLTLVKPAVAPPAPEKDAWYTGADFFRFRADKNATAESPYYAWKDKVEPVWGADADDVSNGCIVCNVPANVNPQSQIWIRGTEAGKTIANGSKDGFKITFRVKADGEYTLESQAHNNWGYKTGQNPFGPLNVTTEWQTVSFVCTGEKAKNDFTDLCFNLSGDAERTIYFDDVQIVRGSEWYLNNEFHAKDYLDPAATYTDTDTPHPLANYVAEGGYVQVVSNASPSQPYNSQIWIQIPDEWVGKTTKMTFEVMADQVVSAPESYQATATGKGWGANAAPSASAKLEITEQDKWITIERILNTENVKSNAGAPYSSRQVDQYCVDLSNNADPITYKFRNVKFEEYVPTYAITITEAENGSVAADVTEAAEGAKVTLTITPAEGYELDALSVAAGETPVEVADDNSFTMPAAAVTVTATFKAVESGEEDLLPAPETDPDYANFVEIPLDQQDVESDDVHLAPKEDKGSYTQFTTTDGICVVFKMKDIDVTDCDYITIKFAKPAPAGQSYAVWTGNDNKGIDEGVSEIKYVFAEDPKCKIQNGILPEVSIISIFTGAGKDVSVYGVYKHKAAPALAYTDLTKEMFFVWSDWTDADATAQAGCAYEVGTSSDMPYGDGSVINYADLSEYATLEVTTTEGAPRFLFNRDVKDGQWNENEADSHLIDNTKGGWSAKYFTSKDNGDGSTTYIVDIAALVADKGYAHLHSIKGANWAKTTVTDMKLGYVGEKPALPTIVPVAINGIAEGASVKDGKYFINGQIVIVKNGKKFNAAGVEIK